MYERLGTYEGELEVLLGRVAGVRPQRGGGGYTCTPLRATREAYEPLLRATFPGTWTRCTLVVVWPNGHIMPHFGKGEVIADNSTRYHLVIKTNGQSWSMHENEWQRLDARGIYTFDPRLIHASINWGAEWRIHFVVDVDGGIDPRVFSPQEERLTGVVVEAS